MALVFTISTRVQEAYFLFWICWGVDFLFGWFFFSSFFLRDVVCSLGVSD